MWKETISISLKEKLSCRCLSKSGGNINVVCLQQINNGLRGECADLKSHCTTSGSKNSKTIYSPLSCER